MMDATPLSDAKRKLLEKYYSGSGGSVASPVTAIVPRPVGAPAPVSLSQEPLLLRERQGRPPLYNECIRLKMKGPVDVLTVERSLREIIRRHEIWRTSYALKDGQLTQVVKASPEHFGLPVVDLTGWPKAEADQEIE